MTIFTKIELIAMCSYYLYAIHLKLEKKPKMINRFCYVMFWKWKKSCYVSIGGLNSAAHTGFKKKRKDWLIICMLSWIIWYPFTQKIKVWFELVWWFWEKNSCKFLINIDCHYCLSVKMQRGPQYEQTWLSELYSFKDIFCIV